MSNNYFDFLSQNAPSDIPVNDNSNNLVNLTVRADAECTVNCDGDFLFLLEPGKIQKEKVPVGQHILEFVSTDNPDVKIEKVVDYSELGKNYVLLISELNDKIDNKQKTTDRNLRLTVGKVKEVYDYLRLLFARAGEAFSYLSGEKMVKFTEEQIVDLVMNEYGGQRIYVLAPLVRNRKGHYEELFESIRRKGYLYVRVDGELRELKRGMKLAHYQKHDIDLLIEKLIVNKENKNHLAFSVALAMKEGNDQMVVISMPEETIPSRPEQGVLRHYSKRLMCPVTGLSYHDPAPHNFSFNSPQGFCPKCKGLGYISAVDEDKVLPDRSLSVRQGAIAPLGPFKNTLIFRQITNLLNKYDYTLDTPISEMSNNVVDELINGSDIEKQITGINSEDDAVFMEYMGIAKYVRSLQQTDITDAEQEWWADQFALTRVCPECGGARLNKEALNFLIDGKNIYELTSMDIQDLYEWACHVEPRLSDHQRTIASEILKEIRTRLRFMLEVGLNYLSLNTFYIN